MPPYGIDQILLLVGAVADIINDVLNGGGLMALLGLLKPLAALKTVNFPVLVKQIQDADAGERQQFEKSFTDHLNLTDKALQDKIVASVGYLDKCVDLVGRGVSLFQLGESLVAEAKDLVRKIRDLFS